MTDSRAKGRKGESDAKALLAERDYEVHDLTAGIASCDLIAIDKNGNAWSVEVKDTVDIRVKSYRSQARRQARKHSKWMLMCHIYGTRSWLIERQGERPCVWHERGGK